MEQALEQTGTFGHSLTLMRQYALVTEGPCPWCPATVEHFHAIMRNPRPEQEREP